LKARLGCGVARQCHHSGRELCQVNRLGSVWTRT
jgi:hypothetical protein